MAFFICSQCGYGSASWLGRCPNCGEFNTLKEAPSYLKDDEQDKEETKKLSLIPFKKIQSLKKDRLKTGVFEFDRVFGGGIVPGEVVLLTGEPGVGKSTLLLQVLSKRKTVYISGEEAAEQVKERAERLNINLDNFLFSDDLQVEGIIEGLEKLQDKVEVVVIDSIQTVYSKKVEGPPGSISQLKESAAKLINLAKNIKTALIIVGHITKGGEIAGPKSLEHLVDCVLNFEGERVSNLRILRANKNRFGPTDEIGIFEMKQEGLVEVTNQLIFLENKEKQEVGKAIVGIVEGKRPLFFEIQTLAVSTFLPVPRRVVKGLDYNKVLLLLAVVRKYLGHPLDKFDIYVNVVGGVQIKSTASDLGFIASLLSSLKNTPLMKKSIFVGEVGLLGEVRKVNFEDKIIKEAKRFGFRSIYSSSNLTNVRILKDFI
ncbi:DNA repair protein RadA [Candidatus Roizmanbacteria bacterium RIFCSPLOWO2_01_FULL_37_13]|uniref:DNA repair protein RadA n=1 Tax=Candidatus Roizmanbacteria bacterium RIFCSPHIGHO2_02_FULL_38_11 TaxID=1802039 RepID=A0A1F7H191_9BACT|nr:MAG: DNA repair protein RadA [Candidatus Roizmanbacteria bacterium RIFCSPHIGHO2_02_FULL_38_11]OGK35310.1 MAG: DNA repair protein RadA [Candidatus Roizmanbacteria bacterium RIFCSPHIGHO2_12_FULL_37_9b]OGK41418.1 MAG: DNA repair protein RadA [Candidatus Roizmanbacteria bacterium RIFCSPLOWO2_01_FULL_37_13]